jgi:hypothetical protein
VWKAMHVARGAIESRWSARNGGGRITRVVSEKYVLVQGRPKIVILSLFAAKRC